MTIFGPPEYKGKRRRCDYGDCDRAFRDGDIIAVVQVRIEGFQRFYEMTYCFNQGDLRCLRFWRFQYEAKGDKELEFEVMVYRGRKRGRGHSEGSYVEA